MRLVPVLGLSMALLTLLALASAPAEAADLRVHPGSMRALPAPPPARTPSVLRGPDPGLENFDRHGRDHDRSGRPIFVVPQTVFVSPSRCWQPGYWTYQFVPQTYTYSSGGWVPGQWSPDGQWIDGHYATGAYNSGYYQPLWDDGYYTACQ